MDKRRRKRGSKKPKHSKQNNIDKYIITHSDEQLEGALMECLQILKVYCVEGSVIVKASGDKWKVLSFGGSKQRNFELVLGDSLRAGVEALETGGDNITNWDA